MKGQGSPSMVQVRVYCRRWVLAGHSMREGLGWSDAVEMVWRAYRWEEALRLGGAIAGWCVNQVDLVAREFGVGL